MTNSTQTLCVMIKDIRSGYLKLKWTRDTKTIINRKGSVEISSSVCACDLCLQRLTIPGRLLDVKVNDLPSAIPHACSPQPLFALLPPPPPLLPLLLKLMTWLLISPVWGLSTLSNGIIQAPFIPIFNYS